MKHRSAVPLMSYRRALRTMPFTAVIMGRQEVNKTW